MAWIIFGILVYLLILFSERVLMSISPHDLEQFRTDGSARARRAYHLSAQVRSTLTALLLARLLLMVIVTVFAVLYGVRSPAIRQFLYNLVQQSGLPAWLPWWLTVVGLSCLLTLFFWGAQKIIRPAISGERARRKLFWLSPFLLFWKLLFKPFLPKINPDAESHSGTPSLAAPPGKTPEAGAEKQRDIELLKSIVKFSDVTVKQVMQPRSKVVAADFRTGFHDLLAIVREAGFSRMPVFDEDLDNVTGILYVKDLVPHLDKPGHFEWQSLIRTNIQLVPESKRISELLQEFKRNRRHMAIVVDEYGGSAGIVTMEDILEEITGEIRDEFDEESEIRYRKLDDHNFLFEGQTLLNDVCRIAGLAPGTFDEIRGGADTLAGLALELKGDIPKPGTEIAWNEYLLTVVAADERRIEQLKLTI